MTAVDSATTRSARAALRLRGQSGRDDGRAIPALSRPSIDAVQQTFYLAAGLRGFLALICLKPQRWPRKKSSCGGLIAQGPAESFNPEQTAPHDSHAEYGECCSIMFAVHRSGAGYHLYATRHRSARGKRPHGERGPLRAGGNFLCCSSGPTWSSSFNRSASPNG